MKNKGLLIFSLFILIGLVVRLLTWWSMSAAEQAVAAMVEPTATVTHAPIQVPSATPGITQPAAAAVVTTEARVTTYMYRLDDNGQAIWQVVGEVAPGELVKLSSCLGDGYAQVEYRDPSRPSRWLVQFVKCGAE